MRPNDEQLQEGDQLPRMDKNNKPYSHTIYGWLASIFNINENMARWFLNIVMVIASILSWTAVWKELGPSSDRASSTPEGKPLALEQPTAKVKG